MTKWYSKLVLAREVEGLLRSYDILTESLNIVHIGSGGSTVLATFKGIKLPVDD